MYSSINQNIPTSYTQYTNPNLPSSIPTLSQIQPLFTKEETFVYFINSLSSSIKTFMKSTKQTIKESQTTSDEASTCLETCDNNIKDLYGEVTSFGKTGNKIIKDRISQVHSLFQTAKALHNDITKQVKIIDGFSMKFYEDAKDIFKNLKNLHNDKMSDLKKLAEQELISNESNFNTKTVPSKKRGQSASSNSNKGRSKLHIDTGGQQYTIGNSRSKLNREIGLNSNNMGGRNKRNVNMAQTNDMTESVNELYEENKVLKDLNEKLKYENQVLKKQTEQGKTMAKSKSLRNFGGSVQKCVDNASDNKQNDNKNENCNQCKDIAENVLGFLTAMKDLQTNIVKKSPNINELKKDFEKQKHDLNILVKSILSLNSNNSISHTQSNSTYNKSHLSELESKIKSLQTENEILKKNNTSELNAIKSILDDIKKQNTSFKSHIEELETRNKQLQNEKDNSDIKTKTILEELNKKSIEIQTLKENENALNVQIDKIKNENANEVIVLKKTNKDLNKDVNELKLTINKLNSSLQNAERKEKENVNEITKLKLKLETLSSKTKQTSIQPQIQSGMMCYGEMNELIKMINKLHIYVNNKHKDMRNGSNVNVKNSNEIIRNPNEAFLIDEDIMNMNMHKIENSNGSQNDENDSILSNVNNNNSIDIEKMQSKEQITLLMDKTRNVYNETQQILKLIFTIYDKKLNTVNSNGNDSKQNNNTAPSNDIDSLKKQYELVNNENQYLKSFFKECVNSIFASIKETAPHMVEDESEISFNIVSGPNTPNVNNNNNLIIDSKGKEKEEDILLSSTFDPEMISNAVSKFKAYNEEITDQLKQLTLEKENLEKEAHDNLVKAKAYKSALDDAISRVNASYTNTNEDITTNPNNNINNNGSLLHEGARAFTVEDLENPQSETPHSDNKKAKPELNEIKTDLLKQLHNKDDQIEQMQETINNLLAMANPQNKPGKTIKDKMVISADKYDQLLSLYTNEQNKNRELRNTYYEFLSKFNCAEMEESPNKKELTLGNEEDEEDDKKSMGVEYQINQVEMQELLNENKDLKEREELLMTQLSEVKEELKQTRKQVQELNAKLKEDGSEGGVYGRNEEFMGTLRNAIERLVNEMQVTSKIKEFLTVVLRLVGYSEEQIAMMYQAKEKKKGFFNKFK